jgi:micrococcal nuclease
MGEVLVNARMIAEGWGHVFVIGSSNHVQEFLQLQKKAQTQHKGMWRDGISSPLKITTVHVNAAGDDRRNPNGEYVRICNVSDKPLGLQGFSIQDAERHRYAFSSGVLEPGYTALLVSGKGQNTTRRGQLIFYWGLGPIWNNDEDTASLFDPEEKLIDTVHIARDMVE